MTPPKTACAALRVLAAGHRRPAISIPADDTLEERAGPGRPRNLDEYVGQERVVQNPSVHPGGQGAWGGHGPCALSGPPPKTSLAHVIAEELGVDLRPTSGPVLERGGDLAAILNSIQEREVLFIDEIHRLNRAVEERLYSAMEDFRIDIKLGEGPGAQSVNLPVPRFTLVGATTRAGLLTRPLRDRFQIQFQMEFYGAAELAGIVRRSAARLGVHIDPRAAEELARRSRGTPRVANRLLRRARDFAEVEGDGAIDVGVVRMALEALGIDEAGLDGMDRKSSRRSCTSSTAVLSASATCRRPSVKSVTSSRMSSSRS